MGMKTCRLAYSSLAIVCGVLLLLPLPLPLLLLLLLVVVCLFYFLFFQGILIVLE
jgi:hypothetical protein